LPSSLGIKSKSISGNRGNETQPQAWVQSVAASYQVGSVVSMSAAIFITAGVGISTAPHGLP